MGKSRSRRYVITLAFIIFAGNVFAQGYKISMKVPDFAGREVILAEYFTGRMVPKDTAKISITGDAVFSGETSFEGGLYVFFFDPQHYFDFLLDKDQEFSVSADSSVLTTKPEFTGSEINERFYAYKNYLADQREIRSSLEARLSNAAGSRDSAQIREKLEKLDRETNSTIDMMIDGNRDNFFGTFLLAMKDNRAPEEILKGTKRQKDSIRYVYYKEHYFDHFDASDIRLLHTPLYEPKIKNYINKVVPQHPDSLISAVDMLIEKSRSHEDIFRYMLITLFNNFAESKMMGMDKVYFHIAEKYYIPEASWSSADFINKLRENLEKSRYTFIGETAPDFELKALPREHFQMAEMDTAIKQDPHVGYNFMLSQVPADYTILYFWEADCGHCQKSTPVLYDVYEKYKDQGVEVVAVHVINSVEGKVEWIDFVNEHQLYDWINCWSPYNNDFRKMYNLQSFPQLFLLDKDKKIIAKTLTPEQVDDLLNRFLN